MRLQILWEVFVAHSEHNFVLNTSPHLTQKYARRVKPNQQQRNKPKPKKWTSHITKNFREVELSTTRISRGFSCCVNRHYHYHRVSPFLVVVLLQSSRPLNRERVAVGNSFRYLVNSSTTSQTAKPSFNNSLVSLFWQNLKSPSRQPAFRLSKDFT